jgi:hypothetical protein
MPSGLSTSQMTSWRPSLRNCSIGNSTMYFLFCVYFAFSHKAFNGNLRDRGPVTAVASPADHHDQSIGQVNAYSSTPSRVHWNAGCSVTRVAQMSAVVFCIVQDALVAPMFTSHSWLGTTWEMRFWSTDTKLPGALYKCVHRIKFAICQFIPLKSWNTQFLQK